MKETLVTRTIKFTKVTVLGVNEITGEAENRTYVIPGTVLAPEKALKMATNLNEDPQYHPSVVIHIAQDEKVYALDITKFMELAHEIVRPLSQQKKAN
jgi:hypothetical protein